MKIKEQLRRRRMLYLFDIFVPALIWCEIMACIYKNVSKKEKQEWYVIGTVIVIVILSALLIHVITEILFLKNINCLNEAVKRNCEGRNLKIGNFLINEDVILEYGMFRKRVIRMDEIEKAELSSYQTDANIRYMGKTTFTTSVIVLKRKEKKQISIKAPVNLFGNEVQDMINAINDAVEGKCIDEKIKEFYETFLCEIPFYGILSLCIIPVMKGLVLLHPYIRDLFIDNQNKIKTVLFCVAYEARIEVIVLVVMCLFLGAMFYWKYCMRGLDFETGKHYFVLICIGLILMSLKFLLPWDYSTYKDGFQTDYGNYKNGNCEVINTSLILTQTDGNGWDERMQDIVERYDINIDEYYSEELKQEFYIIDDVAKLDKEKIYKVKYLANSKIVVDIQEVD